MAEVIEKTIKIDVSGAVESLEDLREEVTSSSASFSSLKEVKSYIDSLKASLMDLDETSEEYSDTLKQISDVEEKYNKILSDTSTTAKSAEGSYNALSKQMSELKKKFKETNDEAERQSLAKQITGINDKLKEMDASIGNYQRNVGNYQSAFTSGISNLTKKITEMGNPLKAAKQGIINLGKAFMANPIGAVITAIVAAIAALKKAVSGSEQATNDMKKAFSSLEPIINGVKNAFTGMGKVVSKIAGEWIPNLVNWVNKIRLAWKNFQLEKGWIDQEAYDAWKENFDKQMADIEKSKELTESEIALQKRKRDFVVEEAKLEASISEQRAKAADQEQYSIDQRMGFLKNAIANEQKINNQRLAIAEEEYRIALERSRQTDNTIEDNERLAQSEANVWRVRKEHAEQERRLSKELATLQREKNGEQAAADKEEEKAIQEAIKLREKEAETIKEINERLYLSTLDKYEKEYYLVAQTYNKEYALLKKYQQETYDAWQNGDLAAYTEYEKFTDMIIDLTNELKSNISGILTEDVRDEIDGFISRQDELLSIASDRISLFYDNAAEGELKFLEKERENFEQRKEFFENVINGDNFDLFPDELKNEIIDKYNQVEDELEKIGKDIKRTQKEIAIDTIHQYSDMTSAIGQLMGEIASFWQENIKARQKAGKINEAQAKKEFEDSKKLQIASAVVTGLAGIATAVATAMELGPILGPIMGAINGTIVAVSTALQIAKIKSTTYDGGGSSSSVQAPSVSSVSPTDVATAYTPSYTANLTGESETENLANAVGRQQMNQRVYVVESDIQEAGRRVDVREEEATF